MSGAQDTGVVCTRQVSVGDSLMIGGKAAVVVQSMLNTATEDVEASLLQIAALEAAGCELVRVAIPNKAALEGFAAICKSSTLPVVADIHFDYRLAIAAVELGAAKLRINPGNIGPGECVNAVIDAAKAAEVPIRIGVNAGSLARAFEERTDLSHAQKLVESCVQFVDHFEARGFGDIVLSAKAHDVRTTVEAYRMLASVLPHIPLHIGITEAGTALSGTIKSAAGLGALLLDGIGDTLRVSLTADPVEEVRVAWELLAALGLRRRSPELVSCPTCGRCKVDLIRLAGEVERRLQGYTKPISVAVMGCVVNGPGEAKDADVGVACGEGKGAIFVRGKIIRTVAEDQIIAALFAEIEAL